MPNLPNLLFAVKPESNVCRDRDYNIMTEDGKNIYCDETITDYIAQGIPILSRDEFEERWKRDKAAYEVELCNKWQEITKERFWDQLDVLPPIDLTRGGFFMGELYDDDIGYFYQEFYGKYYSSFQNTKTPRQEIMEHLRQAIADGRVKPIETAA